MTKGEGCVVNDFLLLKVFFFFLYRRTRFSITILKVNVFCGEILPSNIKLYLLWFNLMDELHI